MSVRSDADNEAKEGSRSHSPPAAASTPSSTGQPSDASANNDTLRAPAQEFESEQPQLSEDYVESDEDQDEDLEPPGWDGIRRRKRVPGQTRIRPAYYYPLDPAVYSNASRQGMKGVPVFEPTMDEFRDFYDYIEKIDNYGMRSGIVKVVPPKEWTGSLPDVKERLKMTRIKEPIAELFNGSTGLFRQTSITKSRLWNPKQWKDLSETPKFAMPDFFGTGDPVAIAEARKAGKRDQSKAAKEARAAAKASAASSSQQDTQAIEEDDGSSVAGPADETANNNDMQVDDPTTARSSPGSGTGKRDRPRKSISGRRPQVSAAVRAEVDDAEWENFDYKAMMHGLQTDHFTVENSSDVEKRYWRTLTFGEPPMYGADMAGSLFTEETTSWNVANLNDLLKRMCPYSSIPGVTQPYLYFGMWRATFSWHVEDADLYSINYVHFGAPKFWYSVRQAQYERFERVMANFFPIDRKGCSEFLRHKAFLASPKKLADHGITLNRCVQHAGEFIITYPKGYHSGFNAGFNCAESINFATERWLEYGKHAKPCRCRPDSVRLNADDFLADARRDALTDPAIEAAIPERYREGPIAPEPLFMPPTKRLKLDPYSSEAMAIAEQKRQARAASKAAKDADAQAKEAAQAKKAEKALAQQQAKIDAKERQKAYVCCLCPEPSTVSLVKLGQMKGKQGKDPKRALGHAHKLCAMFMPETGISVDPETGEEVVDGVEDVEKARWNLKCQVCPDKHGAKIQCVKGKCSKAYHVTCAIKPGSGAFLDAVIGQGPSATKLIADTIKDAPGLTPLDVFAVAPPEEDESGVLNSPPPSPTRALLQKAQDSHPTSTQPSADSTSQPSQSELPTIEAPTPEEVDPLDFIQQILLCRQHNPDWVKSQAENKLKAAWDQAQTLSLDSIIKVKTSGGVFAVKLIGFLPDKNSVQVVFEDGKQSTYKVTAIVWKESEPKAAITRPLGESMSRTGSSSSSRSRSGTLVPPPPSIQALAAAATSAAPLGSSDRPTAPPAAMPTFPYLNATVPHPPALAFQPRPSPFAGPSFHAPSSAVKSQPPQQLPSTKILPPGEAVLPPPPSRP